MLSNIHRASRERDILPVHNGFPVCPNWMSLDLQMKRPLLVVVVKKYCLTSLSKACVALRGMGEKPSGSSKLVVGSLALWPIGHKATVECIS